jgi:hypothetical protein
MWPTGLCIKGREELDAFIRHFVQCIKFHRILRISKIARIFLTFHALNRNYCVDLNSLLYSQLFSYSVRSDYYYYYYYIYLFTVNFEMRYKQISLSHRVLLEANSFQAIQEFTCILWYMKFHYLFSTAHHSSLSIKLINPILVPIPNFFEIYFNIILLLRQRCFK